MIQQRVIETDFDLLDLHAAAPERYPHLLESCAPGPQGRFDILFAFPGDSIELRDTDDFDFLDRLDEHWRDAGGGDASASELPFRGGWFLYLSYELAGQIEPQLRLPRADNGMPVAVATRIPAALIVDRLGNDRWIVAENRQLADDLQDDINRLQARSPESAPFVVPAIEEDPSGDYLDAVQVIKHYIREGDVFQANLSRQWRAAWPKGCRSEQLYRRLRKTNPGPFNGLASWGDRAIISSSPERLVEVRGDRVQTRPIAGTRPRGSETQSDRNFSSELLEHPKERAEHIMLIDLERNDLGRIAVPGSVCVSELMVLESYATVHHIVSNVQARKRYGVSPGEVIRAVFPGGTITGCPKVRCMEIIAELEATGRGAYTGSMGYLNLDGSMDLSILIRTMERNAEHLVFRAGAGIVNDSVAERELDETRAKARGMLQALQGGADG